MACINDRYVRQTIMSEIGKEGQKKLKTKTILIVGLGALGTVQAELLTRAGVGKLILIDPDNVELNNLQRQSLYIIDDIDNPKVLSAKKRLLSINPKTKIFTYISKIEEKPELFEKADIILDGSDNLKTRKFINKHNYKKRTIIFSSAIRDKGIVLVIKPDSKYSFDTIFKNKKTEDSCENLGVINGATHLAGTISATEAIKHILGLKNIDGLFSFSLFNNRFDIFKIK